MRSILALVLAAAWAGVPWMLSVRARRPSRPRRVTVLAAWSVAGVLIVFILKMPHPAWWVFWIGLVWFFELEFKRAQEGLQDVAEAPALELRRKSQPLDALASKLQLTIQDLHTQVSACIGRYLAMKDFHQSLRLEERARAVANKMLKLSAATETAVGVWDAEGRLSCAFAQPADKADALLERATDRLEGAPGMAQERPTWWHEERVEGARILLAATMPKAQAGGPPPEESLRELILPLPTLWRQSLLYARVEEMAIVDRLTGLYVRRLFDERIQREMSRSTELKKPLSLVMVDVDHFKRFNDTFGHLLGDQVLRLISQTLAAEVRKTDFAARYGGEEIALLLPETPLSGALLKAERLRKAVEKIRIPTREENLTVTASFGVAEFAPIDHTPADFIHRADHALYRAKETGRNRVEISE